jgi:hypothetical protein
VTVGTAAVAVPTHSPAVTRLSEPAAIKKPRHVRTALVDGSGADRSARVMLSSVAEQPM